jgi:hypothetical protein
MNAPKILAAIVMIVSFCFPGPARDQQDNQTLFEEVTVVNTQLPVRVFLKGKPVNGLEKKDFKIFVDGKERPINAFYEVRKKLNTPPPAGSTKQADPTAPGRLFVFIFNVSDYHMDLQKDIDILFDKILRPNDRFMAISNNFFLPEITVKNPEAEKKKVMDTLQKEIRKLKMHTLQVERELRSIADKFIRDIEDPYLQSHMEDFPAPIFGEFFRNYLFALKQFRQGYFGMAKSQYIKLAEYLKSQDVEKWVLNFYQVGIFPQPKLSGRIQSTIDAYAYSGGSGRVPAARDTAAPRSASLRIKSMVMQYQPEVQNVDEWMVDNISKLFINTGATVHTLLLLPHSKSMMDHYEYRPIPTDSESILRKIARLTGGLVEQRMDTARFLDEISNKEDIFYMISYEPDKNEPKDSVVTIKIVVQSDKKYRLIYDNKRRPRFFRNIMNKIRENNPQIKIQKILLNGDMLSVVVSNIKTVSIGKLEDSKIGKITAAVTIMDKNSKVVWKTQKTYKSKSSESAFQTKIPALEKGWYDVIVEVKDQLSWKTDTTGENIEISP